MNPASMLCLGGSAVSAALATLSGCTEKPEAPLNVVYILADDLGYGDLGCYGQQLIKTPHIDRMAREGLLFTQHYAGCTVSAPSRCALMTGLHTGHTQVRGNREIMPEGQQPMDANTYTLGRMMKSAGYATGLFGKWGLGHPGSASVPTKMGFDTFYGYNCQRQSHTFFPDHLWSNDEKVLLPENANNAGATYSQELIHRQALRFIRAHKSEPFFAMLTYTLPHAELNVPHDSLYRLYENRFDSLPYVGKFDKERGGYNSSEQPRASFAAMVSRLDLYVGEVLAELKALGIDQQTIVILTSDNGPHREGGADPDFFRSYGPLKGIKRSVYEGGIRVPMVAWCPQLIRSGATTDQVCAFWDVMPTLAEVAGVSLPLPGDGLSFLPTLLDKGQQKQHDYLYWEFHEQHGRQALRAGNWKLIRQPVVGHATLELYDLSRDIQENNNLASQHPDKVNELSALMDGARTESPYFDFGREENKQ